MLRQFLLVLAFALSAAGPAYAGDAVEAQFFDGLARQAYAKRAYPAALDAFLMVNAVTPSAGSIYNVALCADLAGKTEVAFAYYREYLRWEDANTERRVDAEKRLAVLQKSLALVEISSEPPGAQVYVDRRELGAYGRTPTVVAVAPGEHSILLRFGGHEPVEVQAVGVAGETAHVSAALRAQIGELSVVTNPTAPVEILRLGERLEAKPEGSTYRLPVGAYVVRIKPPGHVVAEARVSVRDGASSRVVLVAAPLPVPTGKLLVSTGRTEAVVYVDGERTAATPAVLSRVPAGDHVIELRAQGRKPFRRSISVRAGRTSYLEADLVPVVPGGP